MDSNWASEHLQTIRTLMERSAVYRRALAPIMLSAGGIGVAGAALPYFIPIRSNRAFAGFWMGVGLMTVAITFLLIRRQALRDKEPFWSLPMRRVTEAMVLPLVAGFAIGLLLLVFDHLVGPAAWHTAAGWIVLYGCALNAAGFFTPRGIRLFGRLFVLGGCGLILLSPIVPGDATAAAHRVMGLFFGILHLAYGLYLYFTERQRRA